MLFKNIHLSRLHSLKVIPTLNFIFNRWLHSTTIEWEKKQYYVVIHGRVPGIYYSWDECKAQVNRFTNHDYKKFTKEESVLNYLEEKISAFKEVDSENHDNITILEKLYQNFKAHLIEPIPNIVQDNNYLEDSEIFSSQHHPHHFDDLEKFSIEEKLTEPLPPEQCNEKQFIFDEEGYLVIYTDGACSFNGMKNAMGGLGVYFGSNNPLNISQPLEGRMTSIRAEIRAVILALEIAKREGFQQIKIVTDSQFLISSATQWMKTWKSNDWLTLKHKPVINSQDFMDLDKLLFELDVKWVHVRGHKGDPGNEAAHILATKGIGT